MILLYKGRRNGPIKTLYDFIASTRLFISRDDTKLSVIVKNRDFRIRTL